MQKEKKISLIQRFQIQTKELGRQFYIPNAVQIDFSKKRTGRDYILKARQMGFSTDAQLSNLEYGMIKRDVTVATIAHNKERADGLFKISKFAWDNLDNDIKALYMVKYDNVRELSFGATGSRLYVSLDVRGDTVHRLHISELNFMVDVQKTFKGSLQAVPKGGSITIESTGNGFNEGYDIWREAKEGKNSFTPHFYNWTWDMGYREKTPKSNSWKDDYFLLAKRYGLIKDIKGYLSITDEQWYWYYLKVREIKEEIKAEYPCTDEEAFLSLATSVFNLYTVTQSKRVEPIKNVKGWLIFEEVREGEEYIIGADTSEGVGGDACTGEVFRVDGEKLINVASFRDNKIRPDRFGNLLVEMGYLYNTALLVPEKNNSGLTTLYAIQDLEYPNLFCTKREDIETRRTINEYGWRTKTINRDMMIDDFVAGYEEGDIIINSPYIVEDMKTFVRKPDGKREHEDGYHDDSLFASFVAVQGRKYLQEFNKTKKKVYSMFNVSHISSKVEGRISNLCIGIDYSPTGLVYTVFGIDNTKGIVQGMAEGEGSVEDMKKFILELRERDCHIVIASVGKNGIVLSRELRSLGIRVSVIKTPEEKCITRVQSLLKTEALRVSIRQENLIKDMEQSLYNYDKLGRGEGVLVSGYRYSWSMVLSVMGIWGLASRYVGREQLGEK